jgi:DNA-binding response OmpR family regulator
VIDDEQVILDVVLRILSSEGFAVIQAGDAESGLDQLETDHPDVAIVDLKLPGMSGLEFVSKARTIDPELPVIVTTGVSSVDQAVRALSQGGFDFLPKPFTFEELLAPVYRASRYRSLRRDQRLGPKTDQAKSLLFLGSSTWAKPESDELVRMGVTDLFTVTAGEIEALRLPENEDRVQQGGQIARLKTTDGRSHWVLSPVGGTVVETNGALTENIRQIGDDPFGTGWLVKLRPGDLQTDLQYLRDGLAGSV